MSLDIYLGRYIEYGGPDGRTWHEAYQANITHNLIPMWKLAGVYGALYESHGRLARDILPALEFGLLFMATHPDECRKLDAPNGWGKYDDARPWLRELAEACRRYPLADIRISR